MKYFSINFQAKEHYPQHQEMCEGYDYNKRNSVHRLSNSSFLDTEPDFNFIYVKGSSKLTDFVSSAPISSNWGFIISGKVLEIFNKYNLPDHKVYKIPVIYKEKEIDNYYFINILLNDQNYNIDYTTSNFYLLPNGCIRDENEKPILSIPATGEKRKIEISDFNDYKRFLWKVPRFVEIDLIINENLALDLFKILPFSNRWITDEKLVNDLIKNKVTGLEFGQLGKFENGKNIFKFRK